MTAKILAFGNPKPPIENEKQSPLEGSVASIPGRLHAVLDLTDKRGYYSERLPSSPRIRLFFSTLIEKKVLYVIQEKDRDLLGTDRVCVLSFNKEDELPDKVGMSVADFCGYTAPDPELVRNVGKYIAEYAANHKYIIETEDEDPDDFDNIEQRGLPEVPDFRPEKIPMADRDKKNGYDYAVIEVIGEIHIPANNFTITKEYCPPLLYLLIEAAYQLDYLEDDAHIIQVARYGFGTNKSLILVMNHEEFLALIDASILRSYSLLSPKYDTPEKRRAFIREKFVLPKMDPKLLGGQTEDIDMD